MFVGDADEHTRSLVAQAIALDFGDEKIRKNSPSPVVLRGWQMGQLLYANAANGVVGLHGPIANINGNDTRLIEYAALNKKSDGLVVQECGEDRRVVNCPPRIGRIRGVPVVGDLASATADRFRNRTRIHVSDERRMHTQATQHERCAHSFKFHHRTFTPSGLGTDYKFD
jgi:hypothetical protein